MKTLFLSLLLLFSFEIKADKYILPDICSTYCSKCDHNFNSQEYVFETLMEEWHKSPHREILEFVIDSMLPNHYIPLYRFAFYGDTLNYDRLNNSGIIDKKVKDKIVNQLVSSKEIDMGLISFCGNLRDPYYYPYIKDIYNKNSFDFEDELTIEVALYKIKKNPESIKKWSSEIETFIDENSYENRKKLWRICTTLFDNKIYECVNFVLDKVQQNFEKYSNTYTFDYVNDAEDELLTQFTFDIYFMSRRNIKGISDSIKDVHGIINGQNNFVWKNKNDELQFIDWIQANLNKFEFK